MASVTLLNCSSSLHSDSVNATGNMITKVSVVTVMKSRFITKSFTGTVSEPNMDISVPRT